eukprot:480357-Hanusia_phi.AAC.1
MRSSSGSACSSRSRSSPVGARFRQQGILLSVSTCSQIKNFNTKPQMSSQRIKLCSRLSSAKVTTRCVASTATCIGAIRSSTSPSRLITFRLAEGEPLGF